MVIAAGYNATDALVELQDRVQSSVEPTLSAAELVRLLRYAATTDEDGNEPDPWPSWAATTAYAAGYRVVSTGRNGYVFVVTTAGTSAASEPTWDTTDGETTTDGTVVWTNEDTAPWTPTYSEQGINFAALKGWEMKYAKLTAGETFSADGHSFNPEVRRRDIEATIARFKRMTAGSFRLSGRTSRVENWDSVGSLAVNG